MRAKGIIAILAIVGLLVFVAVSVLGGSKDKLASTRTVLRAPQNRAQSPAGGRFLAGSPLGAKNVPQQINYQGYLVNSSDSSAITDSLQMTFAIYANSVGGSPLWSETHPQVVVGNGLFNVLLGSVNPLPDTIFTGQDLWLETTVAGETFSPRKKLVSVPYAFKDDCWTSSGNDCYFDKSGYVGIGTTSPSKELEISIDKSWIYYDGLRLTNENTSGYGSALSFYINPGGVYLPAAFIGGTADGSGGKLEFSTYNGLFVAARMTIDMNGNVGIGTTDPDYMLDVAGDINTTGDVRKNGTAYNNPDYVFEPAYELISLKELKEFIAEKRHLPNMPSTEEVRKEGVKMFEQNRLMLEKLEEAYLYIFELEERIAKLEEAAGVGQ